MTQREAILKRLTEKARASGFVTYSDILELLPDVEGDVDLLDDLMDSLLEAGIEVIPAPAKPEEVDGEDAKDEKPHTATLIAEPAEEEERTRRLAQCPQERSHR